MKKKQASETKKHFESKFDAGKLRRLIRECESAAHSDHVDSDSIRFDFLQHDKASWTAMQDVTNLRRVSDVIELWESIGFKVQVVERLCRVLPPSDVHPCWKDYRPEDLYCYHSVLAARK